MPFWDVNCMFKYLFLHHRFGLKINKSKISKKDKEIEFLKNQIDDLSAAYDICEQEGKRMQQKVIDSRAFEAVLRRRLHYLTNGQK
jgi:arginine repressor